MKIWLDDIRPAPDGFTLVHSVNEEIALIEKAEMEGAGICSFKIEGRMKSGYYLATVINAYRRAMNGEAFSISEAELLNVAHREYTQAYADGKNAETVNYDDSQSKGDYTYIADVLEVLSPDHNFRKIFTVDGVVNSKGEQTDDCKLVQEIYKLDCPYLLKKGDYLRRKNG